MWQKFIDWDHFWVPPLIWTHSVKYIHWKFSFWLWKWSLKWKPKLTFLRKNSQHNDVKGMQICSVCRRPAQCTLVYQLTSVLWASLMLNMKSSKTKELIGNFTFLLFSYAWSSCQRFTDPSICCAGVNDMIIHCWWWKTNTGAKETKLMRTSSPTNGLLIRTCSYIHYRGWSTNELRYLGKLSTHKPITFSV